MKKKIYEMSRDERLEYLKEKAAISDQDIKILRDPFLEFTFENADKMVENAIGIFPIPLGIATNFVINNKEYIVPMSIEEPSVIAAASKAAKIAKRLGGFTATADESIMLGQIQVVFPDMQDAIKEAGKRLLDEKDKLIDIANSKSRSIKAVDLQIREIHDTSRNNMGSMLVVELIIDTRDAMGANAINTMCEAISPDIEHITKGRVILKILSNYATRRIVKSRAIFSREEIGEETINRILYAFALAYSDVYRAVTHNKGIMNGIDAVAVATGQDFRAIEAAIHAYAARDGTYRSLTTWYRTQEGDLAGEIEIPLAVGMVGGISSVHPIARIASKILNIRSAKELAMIIASAGLAQNFAAIRALASEGIQKGHMRLHAKNIAIMAGARGDQIERIAKIISEEENVTVTRAKELLADNQNIKKKKKTRSNTGRNINNQGIF